jgi:DNA-binding NarL/FixJ family response regulator
MNNRCVIIASNADCLTAFLRDALRDLEVYPVVIAHEDQSLKERIASGYPRFVLLENCFHEQATEEYVLRLVRRYRGLRIVVWSASAVKPITVARYILAGAESFFSLRDKETPVTDILDRIRAGGYYYPAEVEEVIGEGSYSPVFEGELTLREIETVRLCVEGKNTRDIAATLGVKPSTVKAHKLHIYRKCGGNTPLDMLRYALSRGIISLEDIVNK